MSAELLLIAALTAGWAWLAATSREVPVDHRQVRTRVRR